MENIIKQSQNLGEYLTDAVRAVARENPKLQGSLTLLTSMPPQLASVL